MMKPLHTMLLRRRRIRVAKQYGMDNVRAIFKAAHDENVPLYIALALFEQETHGRNIFGHDTGGIFSTHDGPVEVCGVTYPKGSDVPVTPANCALFLYRNGPGSGNISNGVGLGQITYPGYFPLMLEQGFLPWDPYDNARWSLRTLRELYDAQHGTDARRWRLAFGHYNGGSTPDLDYAGQAWTKAVLWEQRLP